MLPPGTAGGVVTDFTFEWGLQDEELWSLGMGFDLLEPLGSGMHATEFVSGGIVWT